MKKQILVFGLIGGMISWIWFLVMGIAGGHVTSGPMGMIVGYAAILLSMTFVFFGVRSYRDNVRGGTISFGKALGTGLLIGLAACLVYTVGWMIIQSIMMPDFYEKYLATMVEQMRASGAKESEIAETQQMFAFAKNPVGKFLMTMMEPLPVALFVSLITALILKKKKTQHEQAAKLA
jgi:hypothetical protein